MVRPLALSATALPANVGFLRREVRCWLADVLNDADLVDDLTLAVSEALENAADHAFTSRPVPGVMSVDAEVDHHRELVVHIRDDGAWQEPAAATGSRGRGIAMMEALAASAVVDVRPVGTRVTLTQPLTGR